MLEILDAHFELDQTPVLGFSLKNERACVLLNSFGATLQSFSLALPGFVKRDVVLGYPSWSAYHQLFEQNQSAYFGAIVGPIAGRITQAKIPFKNDIFHFEANEGPHLLHGGTRNFSNVNWKLLSYEEEPYPKVTFFLETTAYNIALPGNLRCEVSYTLMENALQINIRSIALEDTLANPTQHAYFNPGGHQASVLDTETWLHTQGYLALNKEKLPTGETIQLSHKRDANETFNLSTLPFYPAIDNAFVLDQAEHQAELIAQDGFRLKFSTNQPIFQVYIGGEVHFTGKDGLRYHRYSGICLEQQAEPDAPNQVNFSDIYLPKGLEKTNLLQINFEQVP